MLQVKLLSKDAITPTVAHPGEDLAYDLYALNDTFLSPGVVTCIETGIAARFIDQNIPTQHYGLILKDRSSMASKGITVSGGVIDAGYRNEIKVLLTSYLSNYLIKKGDKIAQMIPIPVLTNEIMVVDNLQESLRDQKGFGSTGR